MKNSALPFVVLAVAVAVAVAVRCRSRGPRVESVRAPDGTVTKVVFYPDSSDGTNSVLTFRNGVLDGPVVRYCRRSPLSSSDGRTSLTTTAITVSRIQAIWRWRNWTSWNMPRRAMRRERR